MNNDALARTLYSAISRLLTPLIRILIRSGVSFNVFSEIAKRLYVNISQQEFSIPGKPQTNTRIATLTGLSRKEVLRIVSEGPRYEADLTDQHNRATRVISGWVRESEFHDKRGMPAALPFDGTGNSFSSLVKRFSGDIPARTILDELLHSGAVRYLKDQRIQLVANAYIPASDSMEKIKMLGTDVSDLISTIDHNLTSEGSASRFQRKVSYNNIPTEHIDAIRSSIVHTAQTALEKMNRDMAKHDRDSNPQIRGTGRKRAGIGIFYFENDLDDGDQR
jgi:Family of unknown function (DUF6502)